MVQSAKAKCASSRSQSMDRFLRTPQNLAATRKTLEENHGSLLCSQASQAETAILQGRPEPERPCSLVLPSHSKLQTGAGFMSAPSANASRRVALAALGNEFSSAESQSPRMHRRRGSGSFSNLQVKTGPRQAPRRKNLSSLEFELAAWKAGASASSSRKATRHDAKAGIRQHEGGSLSCLDLSSSDQTARCLWNVLLHVFGALARMLRLPWQPLRCALQVYASASTSSTASLHAMATQEVLDADHQRKEAFKNLQEALEAAELAEEEFQRASDYLQSVDTVLRWKIEHP